MSAPPKDGQLDQVRRALAEQAKMHAIKKYREETGIGWAAAAEAVERIQAGGTPEPAATSSLRAPAARPNAAAPPNRVVARARMSPMFVLLVLAAFLGGIYGLVYLLTARG